MTSLKTIIVIVNLFITGLLYAQEPITVECRTGKGIGQKLSLSRVEHGNKVSMANAVYNKNDYYGFKFMAEYDGFYVLNDEQRREYPLYLKAGDAVSLYIDRDTVYLTGKKNTKENELLYNWMALSAKVKAKAFRLAAKSSTFHDFFPDFEIFLAAADQFKATIKTKNIYFNELMQRSIDYEKDLYAITFLYIPRSVHPKKEERPAYYTTIINPDKLKDDLLLQLPYGMDLVNKYMTFYCLENKLSAELENMLALVPNENLRGEIVVRKAGGCKSYFEYKKFASQLPDYLTIDQKKRVKTVGTRLYEARKGQPAADFTYPDATGKQVSLSDFKGKVVVVDIWATWCGPCKAELPHLKKLEEEMKGKDVVFIGVSLDKEKDLDK